MASYQTAMDEVFDEDVEEDQIVRKDWNRTEQDIKKTGYRLGLSAGQEETLQQGFDSGYARAAEASQLLGKVQGEISAYVQIVESGTDLGVGGQRESLAGHLRGLQDACSRFEQRYMLQVGKWPLAAVPVASLTIVQPSHSGAAAAPLQAAAIHAGDVAGHRTPLQTAPWVGGMGQVTDLLNTMVGGMGEVTDLLNTMSVQESAPVTLAAFLQRVQQSMLQIVPPLQTAHVPE